MAFLAIPSRIPSHLRHPPFRRDERDAAPHLYIPTGPRTRHAKPDRIDRSGPSGGGGTNLDNQRCEVPAIRRIGWRRPLGRMDARMVNDLAAARIQLRNSAG